MSPPKIQVVYEDNHLIVVVKPFGIESQDGPWINIVGLVKDYIKYKYAKPGEVYLSQVHRLDRRAGGLMLFAKTSKAAERLARIFRERQIAKQYLAVCEGNPPDSGRYEDMLYKDENERKAYILRENEGHELETKRVLSLSTEVAKEATLSFRRIETVKGLSLLSIALETGRFHQIRAQLSDRGFPLFGDVKYGARQRNEFIALYCFGLTFVHPVKKEPITLVAPVPSGPPWDLFAQYPRD